MRQGGAHITLASCHDSGEQTAVMYQCVDRVHQTLAWDASGNTTFLHRECEKRWCTWFGTTRVEQRWAYMVLGELSRARIGRTGVCARTCGRLVAGRRRTISEHAIGEHDLSGKAC